MLVEFVVTTHRVEFDMVHVPDGHSVDVEVITALLGAEEALERGRNLLDGARGVIDSTMFERRTA